MEKQDAQDQAKLETLRAAAAVDQEDLKAGRYETVDIEDVEAFLAALRERPGKP